MNRERLKALAIRIKSLPFIEEPESEEPLKGFNMLLVHFECGTPACIAGHTLDLFHLGPIEGSTFYQLRKAQEILDLTSREATTLFNPPVCDRYDIPLSKITPQSAALAIERLLEGEEDIWEHLA